MVTSLTIGGAAHSLELRIYLLGRFEVYVGTRPVAGLAHRPRTAVLLKLLALAPGHRLHREEVLDLLWPELDPEAAVNNLHSRLHALRHLLEPGRARGTPSAYLSVCAELLVLHVPGGLWIDVEAFELACTVARDTGDPAAYESARELYAGDLVPDDRYADWAISRREALRERYRGLLLELAGVYERQRHGHHPDARGGRGCPRCDPC